MSLTESLIRKIFEPVEQGDWQSFLDHIKDDVDWTVVNPNIKSFPIAGVFDKQGFISAIAPLNECFPHPLAVKIQHIHMVKDADIAIVELRAQSVANDGKEFDNMYAWICEFDGHEETAKIKAVRAYLDSALVKDIMASNVQ